VRTDFPLIAGAVVVVLLVAWIYYRTTRAMDAARSLWAARVVGSLVLLSAAGIAALASLAEGAEDYDQRLLIVALAGLPATFFVASHGAKRFGESIGRGIGWFIAALFGFGFASLGTISAFMKEPEMGGYAVAQQLVRGAALVTGVVLVLTTILAVLPVLLDALEGRGFIYFVSARMLHATKSGFLTVISVLSVLAVSLSSCTLCSVTSIMGGFGADLKRKILGNTAHIMVDVTRPSGFEDWKPALEEVRKAVKPYGGTASPVAGGDAMASSVTNTAGTLMRGIDPASVRDVIDLVKNIDVGKFEYLTNPAALTSLEPGEIIGRGPGGEPYYRGPGFKMPDFGREVRVPKKKIYPGIILGRELAKSLHVMVGDELTMLSPMGELGPMGIMPRARKFRVAALFYSGMYEYDASHAYVLLEVAQKFLDLEGRITSVDVRIPEPEVVAEVTPAVQTAVAKLNDVRMNAPGIRGREALRVRDWKEMNKNLFSALKLEKVATFIILSLATVVASFCIICTLLLMVTEKSREIAVLKALGAANDHIMKMFMLQGVMLGVIGTVLGVSTALAACLGLSWTGVRLDPDVYYIDRLPVNVDLQDYGMVAIAAVLICTVATIYPASTAALVRPVDGLRYE
jgi:lipoprotein-releasing system permease protein